MAKLIPENARIERYATQAVLHFEIGGDRYHLWLARATLLPSTGHTTSAILFKNPPLGVKRNEKGWFETSRLDPNSNRWKPVIDGIYAKLDLNAERSRLNAEETAEAEMKEADINASLDDNARRNAAQAMFSALEAIEGRLVAVINGITGTLGPRQEELEEALSIARTAIKGASRPNFQALQSSVERLR